MSVTKKELRKALETTKADAKEGMQLIWDDMSKGQQKQRLKNEKIKALLDRYGVEYE